MAATSQSLQEQVESLQDRCPVIAPTIIPQGYDTRDLVGLVQHLGDKACDEFQQFLDEAGSEVRTCCVCGAAGEASTSGSDDDKAQDAKTLLSFATFTDINFANKALHMRRAGFACGLCRALKDTHRVVQFAATRVNEAHPESLQLTLELALHLASVNRAAEPLQSNPEALTVWFQELYSKAYALQVVASNLRGWRVLGPDGEAVDTSSAKAVLALARELLAAGVQPKAKKAPKRKHTTPTAVTVAAAADGATGKKAKKQQQSPAPLQQQEQQQQQRRKKDGERQQQRHDGGGGARPAKPQAAQGPKRLAAQDDAPPAHKSKHAVANGHHSKGPKRAKGVH